MALAGCDRKQVWMRAERARLSRNSPVAETIAYMLKRWEGFTTFLGDGRILPHQRGRTRAASVLLSAGKAWLFAGSDRGADRAAFVATLINTAKPNGIDPQAWLAAVLAR